MLSTSAMCELGKSMERSIGSVRQGTPLALYRGWHCLQQWIHHSFPSCSQLGSFSSLIIFTIVYVVLLKYIKFVSCYCKCMCVGQWSVSNTADQADNVRARRRVLRELLLARLSAVSCLRGRYRPTSCWLQRLGNLRDCFSLKVLLFVVSIHTLFWAYP